MDDVADALGVGRRTVFRYFKSKNDLVWGDFDLVLNRLRQDLLATEPGLSTMEAIAAAAVSSNRYSSEELPELRTRMRLITTVSTIQAHSMLRYADWRQVIAEYAASRRGESVRDLIPQAIAHAALGASMSAFSHWVASETADLETNLRSAYTSLRLGFPDPT